MPIENKIDHHSCTKKTVMRPNINIILHSWQAQKLFHGSWKHGQFGLIQFAKTINPIFSAHNKDDPYAEYYILKITDLIFETQAKLRVIEELLSEKLNAVRGRSIELFTSDHPLIRTQNFVSPLTHTVADLLITFDFIIRKILTIKKLGMGHDEENYDTHKLRGLLRRVFEYPTQWQHTGITRQDVRAQNALALKAEAQFGIEVPEAVLDKQFILYYLKRS